MLMPKRTKYRKIQKGKRRGKPVKGSKIDFGEHALQAVESGWMTSRQNRIGTCGDDTLCPSWWKGLD